MRRNQRGFTLMELMVVIVIVAILAAVAVPLYINYVNDAKRSEAKGAIAALISAEQVNYQRTCTPGPCTYANSGDGTGGTIDIAPIVAEASRNWVFTVENADDVGFTVNAVGQADAATLEVQCVYSRNAAPQWTDDIP